MPKTAVPLTLAGVSSRLAGVPMSLKSCGRLSPRFWGQARGRRTELVGSTVQLPRRSNRFLVPQFRSRINPHPAVTARPKHGGRLL